MKALSFQLHLIILSPLIDYLSDKIRLKFNGSCLKQPKLTYTHGKNSKHLHCL